MIAKGNQRGGGQQLATHLLNEFDNGEIEISDIRGAVADDLHGAFAEWRAVSNGTRCRKFLYSLSINPWDDVNGPMTRTQYQEFIERVEDKFGLSDNGRAIVFHRKYGREHCHVVWSRIDVDKMKAVQMSYDHQQLRTLAREFAHDYGWELPEGLERDGSRERFNRAAHWENLAEKQQEERSGISKTQVMEIVTGIWQASDSPKAFVAGLAQAGYYICKGDKIPFAIADRYAEIYSLPKMIDNREVTTKALGEFLKSDYPELDFPSASRATEYARQNATRRRGRLARDFNLKSDQLQMELAQHQKERREALAQRQEEMRERHKEERTSLKRLQEHNYKPGIFDRIRKQPPGIAATLFRITGIKALAMIAHARREETRQRNQQQERAALKSRHRAEESDFKRKFRSLHSVDRREQRSLDTYLKSQHRQIEREAQEDGRQPREAPQELYTKKSHEDDERSKKGHSRHGPSRAKRGGGGRDEGR